MVTLVQQRNRIRLLVNSIAFHAVAVAVAAALAISVSFAGEFPLSDLTFGTMPNVYASAVVAAGPTGALALWNEAHGGIWAAPLDLQGRLRGVAAFRIAESGGVTDLVWNGSTYFMAWISGGLFSRALHVAELDTDGRMLRDETIEVPLVATVMAWNGTNLLIVGATVWSAPQPGLFAVTLSRDLTLVQQTLVTSDVPFSLALTSVGARFFLATAWWSGLNGYWLSGDGRIESSFAIEPAGGTTADAYRAKNVAVSSDGTTAVAVWTAAGHDTATDLKAAVISDSGVSGPVRQISTGGRFDAFAPELQWNGGEYAVVFLAGSFRGQSTDWLELVGLRLGPNAEPLAERPHLITAVTPRARFSDLMIVGDRYVATITDQTVIGSRNVAITFDQELRLLRREVISRAATFQDHPAVATDGSDFLTVWVERTAETQAVYAGRITRHGERLDGRGIRIIDAEGLFYFPDTAFGGGVYLVVWNSGAILLGARISQDGVLLDEQPFAFHGGAHGTVGLPSVEWNGREFLVASVKDGRIVGTLVSPTGVVQPSKHLSPATPSPGPHWNVWHSAPDLAWNGRNFLLSYVITRMPPCFFPSCSGTDTSAVVALSPDGDPLGDAVEFNGDLPRVASNGEEFMITFTAGRRLWAKAIQIVDGLIISGPDLFMATNALGTPLWVGDSYRVYFTFVDDGNSAVAYRTVDRHGRVVGGAVRLEDTPPLEDIASVPTGEILGVYKRQDRSAPLFGVPRVFGSFLHDAPVRTMPARQRSAR